MTRRYINQLTDGETVDEVYWLADRQMRANRNAELYLLAELRDKTGAIQARMWNVSEEFGLRFKPGELVRVKAKVQLYQGGLQMIASHFLVVPPDTQPIEEFVRQPTRDSAQMLDRLRAIHLAIEDHSLRTLIGCFHDDAALMEKFTNAPAGIKAHHAYRGGLLEHVLTMSEIVVRIADLYPHINSNLLLLGVFLHDLGKIHELEYEGTFAYTDEGQLLGHVHIGIELLNAKIVECEARLGEPLSAEYKLRLKHLIHSHHGSYEFGSPKLPMTPEAIALTHIDNLDAKVHEFHREITDDPQATSNWTPYIGRLERKLFKGLQAKPVPNGPTPQTNGGASQ